ncbi:YciI family protein [Pelagibaculum spongiae]|uniref:Uncharacterized protein n=1 Tax=Pelagibaculum spongiae TaxID=2080658 RepID=A0A2V1GU68_9GAMM|nr:YciI family protein [Pelagibaculum spongiae]PVZ69559.1 hypothetical protein DC094_09580 [Pelagibaculum spongiae]
MAQFIISYLGGEHPTDPVLAKQHFEQYKNWLVSLGDAAISPANPFKNTHHIAANGTVSSGSQIRMSGFTVIEAESIEAAIALAKQCPFLQINGELEVAELIKMGG